MDGRQPAEGHSYHSLWQKPSGQQQSAVTLPGFDKAEQDACLSGQLAYQQGDLNFDRHLYARSANSDESFYKHHAYSSSNMHGVPAEMLAAYAAPHAVLYPQPSKSELRRMPSASWYSPAFLQEQQHRQYSLAEYDPPAPSHLHHFSEQDEAASAMPPVPQSHTQQPQPGSQYIRSEGNQLHTNPGCSAPTNCQADPSHCNPPNMPLLQPPSPALGRLSAPLQSAAVAGAHSAAVQATDYACSSCQADADCKDMLDKATQTAGFLGRTETTAQTEQVLHCSVALQTQQLHSRDEAVQTTMLLPDMAQASSITAVDAGTCQSSQVRAILGPNPGLSMPFHEPFHESPLQNLAHHPVVESSRKAVQCSQQTQADLKPCLVASQTTQTSTQQTQTQQLLLQSQHSQACADLSEACSQTDALTPLQVTTQHTQSCVRMQNVCCQTSSQDTVCAQDACCQTSSQEGLHCKSQHSQAAAATAAAYSQTSSFDEQHAESLQRLQFMQQQLDGARMKVQSLQSIIELQEQQLLEAAGVATNTHQVCLILILTIGGTPCLLDLMLKLNPVAVTGVCYKVAVLSCSLRGGALDHSPCNASLQNPGNIIASQSSTDTGWCTASAA